MAISTFTRKQARSDLRSRLGNVTQEKLFDDELNIWLHVAQIDIASRLSLISDIWYGATVVDKPVTLTAGAVTQYTFDATHPPDRDSFIRITQVIGRDSNIDNLVIPFCRISELYSYLKMSHFSEHIACSLYGNSLYFFAGSDFTVAGTETIDIFYIKRPSALFGGSASDTTFLDVPDEFYDLVIKSAQSKAFQKLGMLNEKGQLDNDIEVRLNEIKKDFSQEQQLYQFEMPAGQQTFRGK